VQEERNRHYPPREDEIWVCEFCEYSRIYGEPPRALIRQYELKDRRVRQEEADRKRLLEKAKAKSRKAKKNAKAAAKGNHAGNHQLDEQVDEHDVPPLHQGHAHSTQSEDDEEGEYVAEHDVHYASPSPQPPTGTIVDKGGGGGRQELQSQEARRRI